MAKISKPRAGSRGYAPRKRARRHIPSVRSWPKEETPQVLGFAGYKAGMTQVRAVEQNPDKPSYNQNVMMPATIIECPPIKVKKVRKYKKTHQGLKLTDENPDEVRIQVETNPPHKKKTEKFELKISGTPEEALEKAESLKGQEISIKDVFNQGQYTDVLGITKGKGIQGPVKRFGIKKQPHKAKGRIRHPGAINPWTPTRTMWTAPMQGQTGFHQRTELNKQILKIKENGGIKHIKNYGNVENDYILIKGSAPGPEKRMLILRKALRPPKETYPVQLKNVKAE